MPASNNSFVSSYSNLTYVISLSSLHLCLGPCFNSEEQPFCSHSLLVSDFNGDISNILQTWKSDEEFLLNTFYLVKNVLLLLIL